MRHHMGVRLDFRTETKRFHSRDDGLARGETFEAVHGQGFDEAHQPRTDAGLLRMARAANLEPRKAQACMSSTSLDGIINAVQTEAQRRYQVNSTPTIIINGQFFGAVPQNADDLAQVIDPMLEGK